MRLWVHLIWRQTNARQLTVAGPRENEKLERMIGEWGEDVTAYAWYLYVNADPRPYNLEPVKHVEKFTSKAGKTYMNQLEDGGSITRFPLSAFLATSEGFIVEAKIRLSQKESYLAELRELVESLRAQIPGLDRKWASVSEG
jgi:hypothetical protein